MPSKAQKKSAATSSLPPKEREKQGRTDPNIRMAETAYITGEVRSLTEAASKYAVNLGTLNAYSSREGWTDKRVAFQKRVNDEAEELLAQELIRAKRDSIRAHLTRARELDRVGMQRVSEGFGDDDANAALQAVKLASELERKVLRMDDASEGVKVQVNLVPLIAVDTTKQFNDMLIKLGGKGGEEQR